MHAHQRIAISRVSNSLNYLRASFSSASVNYTAFPASPTMSHDAAVQAKSQGKISGVTTDLSKTLDPSGMGIVEIIKTEHHLVETLGKQYKQTKDDKEKQGIAHNIIKLLSIQAGCEEMVSFMETLPLLHSTSPRCTR